MISMLDVKAKKDSLFQRPENFNAGLGSYLHWLTDNYEQLEPIAQKYCDDMFDKFFNTVIENLKKEKDTPETRQWIRKAYKQINQHIVGIEHVKVLEAPPKIELAASKVWDVLMTLHNQLFFDVLLDIGTRAKEQSIPSVVIGILYSCVDELTCAHHLARFNFLAQANSHLRCVYEALDKVELFLTKPEFLKVWSGDKAWKLTPKKIRTEIGKEEFDPFYGYLSETGSHVTFQKFRGMAYKDATEEDLMRVLVGGTPAEHLIILYQSLSLNIVGILVSRMIQFFPKCVNQKEVENKLAAMADGTAKFYKEHFSKWAAEQGLDSDKKLAGAIEAMEQICKDR